MSDVRPRARGTKGPLRRIAVALTRLLLAFALLSGLGHANSRYFYCDAMGLLQADPCAAAAQRAGDGAGAQLRATQLDCCEVGTFPPLPQADGQFKPRPAILLRRMPPFVTGLFVASVPSFTSRWLASMKSSSRRTRILREAA